MLVAGDLAVSRALGDFVYKRAESVDAARQAVTAFPDVINVSRSAQDEFIVLACDGLGVCTSLEETLQVDPKPDPEPSLSDFELEDWTSWVKDAGSDLATYIALISVALILGWLVLRESSDLEDEAKQAAETYTDVEHVEVQGGLLGMDQHTPPPAPGILSKEERRNEDSGYVRPLRRRI